VLFDVKVSRFKAAKYKKKLQEEAHANLQNRLTFESL
jgi:hypothetical protein